MNADYKIPIFQNWIKALLLKNLLVELSEILKVWAYFCLNFRFAFMSESFIWWHCTTVPNDLIFKLFETSFNLHSFHRISFYAQCALYTIRNDDSTLLRRVLCCSKCFQQMMQLIKTEFERWQNPNHAGSGLTNDFDCVHIITEMTCTK